MNKEKTQKYYKAWQELNKEKRRKYKQEYDLQNKDKILEYQKQRNQIKEIKLLRNKRDSQKYKNNLDFHLKRNLRSRLTKALKNNSKGSKTLNLLGCSIQYLKLYLKSKFAEGMSWDNYGEWHIDHKKPCARFDLSKPKEQRKCFHYTNLQPLWAIDNIRKGCN